MRDAGELLFQGPSWAAAVCSLPKPGPPPPLHLQQAPCARPAQPCCLRLQQQRSHSVRAIPLGLGESGVAQAQRSGPSQPSTSSNSPFVGESEDDLEIHRWVVGPGVAGLGPPSAKWHQTPTAPASCACRLLRENRQRIKIPDIDEERFESSFTEQDTAQPSSSASGCPVYVMLPLDTVWVVERDGKKVSVLKKERSLEIALHTLKQAGVEGVMVDVWWGIVERGGPRNYDFSAYKRLFLKVAAAGLKVQAVMSFHAAGGNVGDTCKIPLPKWVLEIGEKNPDIFYTDKSGHRNRECLSLGCDDVPLFWGRTPVQVYGDFMEAFCDKFQNLFGGFGEGCQACQCHISQLLQPAVRVPSLMRGSQRQRAQPA